MIPKNTDVAWAAGLLDGEGWIGLAKQTGSRVPRPYVTCGMCDNLAPANLQRILGGKLHGPYHCNNTPRLRWRWEVAGSQRVGPVLIHLLPYLTTKKRAAEDILAFIEWRKTQPRQWRFADFNPPPHIRKLIEKKED